MRAAARPPGRRGGSPAGGGGGQVPGKFPPRPGPAFVVRRGERARPHRAGTAVPAAEKFGEGDGLICFPRPPPPFPLSQLHGAFWGSRRPRLAPPPAPTAASPRPLPHRGSHRGARPGGRPGFSQPFLGWGVNSGGGWLSEQAGRAGGSALGSLGRGTKCCSVVFFFLGALIMFFFRALQWCYFSGRVFALGGCT